VVYHTTPKMMERKQAHREKLLATAVALFGKHGYHLTTVPMIVKKSGSSTGSFYFYFRNKEDVFAAALEAFGEKVADAINSAIAAAGDNQAQQMRAAIERFVTLLAENQDEARILIVESSGLGGQLEAVRRKIVDSHARSVAGAIATLKDSAVESTDSDVLAHCWVGSVYESVRYWLEQPTKRRPSAREMAHIVADFNLRGIGAL
jgi:TetR/AcrR family fatty acid metabolism transcriptional regulator